MNGLAPDWIEIADPLGAGETASRPQQHRAVQKTDAVQLAPCHEDMIGLVPARRSTALLRLMVGCSH
jgi:hypothetical protein